jgi:hypothetical protein
MAKKPRLPEPQFPAPTQIEEAPRAAEWLEPPSKQAEAMIAAHLREQHGRSSASSRERWSVWGRLEGVLVLGVVVALFGAGCGGGGKLGAKALSQESKSLQSLAAEGVLLAQDAVSGKTTRIYTREHSSDLYKSASQAEASLRAAKTEPALEPKLRRLVVLAGQVRADLKRLGGASREEQGALGRALQSAAQESQRIGKGLT